MNEAAMQCLNAATCTCLLLRLCERRKRLVQRGVADMAAVQRGHGALAFRFNDCRSLLPLLPVIAF